MTGILEGNTLGIFDGNTLGIFDGNTLGTHIGFTEGLLDGDTLGIFVLYDGNRVGVFVGTEKYIIDILYKCNIISCNDRFYFHFRREIKQIKTKMKAYKNI